jgi:DNA-directed RNA polymerase subunit RPC12/RpoP
MAIYRCSRCDAWKDGDYDTCSEDPEDELGLMCEDCTAELEDE